MTAPTEPNTKIADAALRQDADLSQGPMANEQSVAVRSESVPAIQEGPGALLNAIVLMAKDPAVDVQKLQALLSMQEHMEERQEQRDRVAAFNRDFDAMRCRLPKIKRDGTLEYAEDKKNPNGPMRQISKFPKWETIMDGINPLMQEYGFRLSWDTVPRQGDGGGLICTGRLTHRMGHFEVSSIPLPLDTSGGKNNLQGYGSTTSYGQRYTTKNLLNLVYEGEDDDGKRGGMKFITEAEALELRALAAAVGQQEGSFLDQLFAGAVRSFDEIEAGPGYLACRSTLEAMKRRNEKRAATKGDT